MKISYPDLTGETATQTSTTVVTLADTTALDDCRLFSTAVTDADLADGDTVFVNIKKDATNLLVWEATYDATAKTLTKVTELAAIGTIGAASTVNVEVVAGSKFFNQIEQGRAGYISPTGFEPSRATTTSISISAGVMDINGVLEEASAAFTIKTSGSEALAASALYYIFIINDAGTLKQHWVKRVDTTDDPQWDDDLGYYKGGSGLTGPEDYRCIGFFATNSSSTIIDFRCYTNSHVRWIVHQDDSSDLLVINSGTATTCTSVDVSMLAPSTMMRQIFLQVQVHLASGTGSALASVASNATECSNFFGIVAGGYTTTATITVVGWLPTDSSSIYYKIYSSPMEAFCRVMGAEIRI